MRAWLAVLGILTMVCCSPVSCNPVSCTTKATYATEVSIEGQKALAEAMKLMEAGYPSAAIDTLAAWDRKAADAIMKIERDPSLSPADRKELLRKITELRETENMLIRAIASGDQSQST